MAASATIRVLKEIQAIRDGADLSLAIAHRESDVRNVRALIIGPPDTPYEFGFFEFKAKFGDKYPITSPTVKSLTTNGGRCRFNPNIYANGKVCLSILGTWRGENGEEWSTAQGLESVLISIQSLMSSNPFENEPSFEQVKISEPQAESYARKIHHETIRITVIQRLEQILNISSTDLVADPISKDRRLGAIYNDDDDVVEYDPEQEVYDAAEELKFDPFVDLYKRRFLWYYDSYLKSIDEASAKVKDGTPFETAPFEYYSNEMSGKFAYASLRSRLQRIYEALEAEKMTWAEKAKAGHPGPLRGAAANTQHHFESLRKNYSTSTGPSVELSLVDKNPLVWTLTFFGTSETDLYGATINVRLHFPPDFPEAQPRVTVLTPLFHHRISPSTKTLCYFPSRTHDVKNHVESIMAAIKDENPSYDPRTLVNPEASALLWGDEKSKRTYRRKLRRSVEDSMDCDDF